MDLKPKILVADDESRYRKMLLESLSAEGYDVCLTEDGPETIDTAIRYQPALVLLELRIPGLDGYTVCERLCDTTEAQIIIMSAHGLEADKIRAFDLGAADYITKPFSVKEMCARVRAVLRRSLPDEKEGETTFRAGNLVVDLVHATVSLRGKPVRLSSTEFRLLLLFVQHPDQVFSTSDLAKAVWGDGYSDSKEIVWVSLSRLRQKLGDDASNPNLILTRPGQGYVFCRKPARVVEQHGSLVGHFLGLPG